MSDDEYLDGEKVEEQGSEPAEEKTKVKKTRNVEKKKLYLCKPVGTPNPEEADTFKVIAGPFKNPTLAYRHVRDELPDGNYVMMFEGKVVRKVTETIAKVRM